MLLCIDAGNSFVKAAYHDGKAWLPVRRCALRDFCRDPRQLASDPIDRIVVSNVAGVDVVHAISNAFPSCEIEWLKTSQHAAGVVNGYENPQQLGIDRWCMLIAAKHLVGGPCVVAALGTALTVDLLSADGAFLGGVIAPGLGLMRTALAQGTHGAQPGSGKVVATPRNTEDGIETGVYYAIQGVLTQMALTLEAQERGAIHYLLTGGNAAMVAPSLNRPFQVVDNLVLEGIRILAQEKGMQ